MPAEGLVQMNFVEEDLEERPSCDALETVANEVALPSGWVAVYSLW